jgi:hypothetical protein
MIPTLRCRIVYFIHIELASFCLESIPEFILVVVYSPNGDKPFQNNILHVQDIKATCNELNTYLDSKIPFVFEFHVPIHSNKRTLLSCPTIPLAKQATYLAILLEPELHTEFEELTFKTMKYLENEWKEDRLLEIGFVSWFNTQANKDTIMFIWNYLIGNNLIQFVHVKTKQWFYPNHSLISIMMANANQSNMLQIPEEFQSIRAALDVNNNPSIQIENCNPDIENVNENLIKIVDKLFPNCKFTLDTNHQCSINNPKGGYKGVFTINNQLYLETSELYDSPTIAKEQVIQFAYDYVSIMFDMKIKCEDDNPIRAISQIAQSLKKKLEWVFEDNKCILILDGAQYVSSPKNTKNDAKLEAAKVSYTFYDRLHYHNSLQHPQTNPRQFILYM